jgi:alcohol dehydrogenase class IV
LPHAMRFSSAITERRLIILSQLLSGGASAASYFAVTAVEDMLRDLQLPRRLRDVGVPFGAIPEIVKHAATDWSLAQLPKPPQAEELTGLVEAAW